jgi:hypothetical protein
MQEYQGAKFDLLWEFSALPSVFCMEMRTLCLRDRYPHRRSENRESGLSAEYEYDNGISLSIRLNAS